MKSALSFVVILLGAGLTGAIPFAKDGVTYDLVPAEPAVAARKAEHVVRNLTVESVEKAQVCVIDIYRAGNPAGTPVTVNVNFDFTSFCSVYLPGATPGPVSTTIFFPSLVTTTGAALTAKVTKTATTTVQGVDPAKSHVEYCPISGAGATCNITTWAGPTGAFHAGTEDLEACHQLCLSEATCKSFQVSTVSGAAIIPQCNLYTVSAGGSNNGTANFNLDPKAPYIVYDKDCPDGLPAGCKQAVPVRSTTAPPPPVPGTTITSTAPAIITSFVTVTYQPPSSPFSISPGGPKGGEVERDVEEKGLEVRDSEVIPPLWILSLIGTVTLSQICTCILGGVASSTATVYGPSYIYATATPTVYKTVTAMSSHDSGSWDDLQ